MLLTTLIVMDNAVHCQNNKALVLINLLIKWGDH